MAVRTRQELYADLQELIRSGGEGGRTTAQQVRSFLTNLMETVFSLVDSKVDRVQGKQMSTEDFTTAEKQKLASLSAEPTGAKEDRFYTKAAFTMTGGGRVNWDGTNLKWSTRFIAIPVDKTVASIGHIDIQMPAAGTVIAGVNGTSSITVTEAGIPMPQWSALLAEHTVGGLNVDVVLKVMVYSQATAGVSQANQLIVAVRNSESNTVRLCTGNILGVGEASDNGRPVSPLEARIAKLERMSAPFSVGGGMVLWNKPANEIPTGWREVVNWRARMPIGYDPNNAAYSTVGNTGGASTKTITASQLPVNSPWTLNDPGHTHPISGETMQKEGTSTKSVKVLDTGTDPNFGDYSEPTGIGYTSISLRTNSGGGAALDVMNPYRVVIFIEYFGG